MKSSRLEKTLAVLLKKRTVIIIYLILAVFTGIKQYHKGSFNNYKIFKYTYWHTTNQTNLYKEYPQEYGDVNHYGPAFSMVIAPFALLPDGIGTVLWNIANALVLIAGFYSLPLSIKNNSIIALICAHEAFGAMLSYQFNVGLTGLILLSFSGIIKQKDVKSAFFIALGFLIKIYGIVGLAFFFFSKRKLILLGSGILFLVLLFVLPMLISSPEYVIQSYKDWFQVIAEKNSQNASLTSMQDISLMGMVRRIAQNPDIPNLPFLIGGILLFALPYLRINQYQHLAYKLMLLSSTLIFTVIFSSSSESPTYIIAFAGLAIWFIIQPSPKQNWMIFLFVFAIILTNLSPSDIFPKYLRDHYVKPYSLKALPCVLIWFAIIYQMLFVDFKHYKLASE